MSLRDVMDADLTEIFLNEDDHAEPARFYPHGNTVGFVCTVLRTASQPSLGGEPVLGGTATPRFRVSLAAMRAGILTLLGAEEARDPQMADYLTLTATGQTATVQTTEPTPGDDLFLNCTIASIDALTVSRK